MNNAKIKKYLSEDRQAPRFRHLRVHDLASIVAGVKSVVYTSVSGREDAKLMDSLCSDLKLEKIELGRNKSVYNERHRWNNSETVDILIGTDHKKLKAAEASYSRLVSVDWGNALDYPECCVKAFVDWRSTPSRRDLVACTMDNSPRGATMSFLLNNVYNFYSRVFEPGADKDYQAFITMNQFDWEAIIPWHPCSYACSRSLAAGRKIFEVCTHYLPHMAADRLAVLSKPLLFWDKFIFAVLDGSCRPEKGGLAVSYSKVTRPKSFLPAAAEKALNKRGALTFAADGKMAGAKLAGKYVFLPFSPQLSSGTRELK